MRAPPNLTLVESNFAFKIYDILKSKCDMTEDVHPAASSVLPTYRDTSLHVVRYKTSAF